jgi:GrpB-like predicted nucleotidyltransferase (UPF0157 family)
MLGLTNGVVQLCPYTTEWQRLFDEERTRLQSCVGRFVLDIQHIGSTAIPGIVAKPILDISVAVANFEEAQVCIEPIERLGYIYRGEYGIPRRHYFVRGEPRTHHLHMVEIASAGWKENLFFRDYLREHPEAAADYARTKIRLAKYLRSERQDYQSEKGMFIQQILSKML